jgi:oligopeptide transport system substrate-binding protein
MGLALVTMALTGCAKREPAADLVIINGKEPESLDPAIISGEADGRVVMALFEGLTRYDPKNGAPEPGLAERWELSPDGRVYTFFLRTNAVWSTGEPLTAADVVYSWRRMLDPKTGADYAQILFYLKNGEAFNGGKIANPEQVGVHALSPYVLRVELVNSTPFFLELCAYSALTVVPRQSIEKHGDRWLTARPLPVSGAYELDAWRLNDRIRLRKNPRYWDAANTGCAVVDLLPITSPTTALNFYLTGGADIVWDKELIPVDLIDVLRKRPDFQAFDYLATYFFRFNVHHKPFDDVRVRKALALAIDKQHIVANITRGGERAAGHLVPFGLRDYESPRGLRHDPEQARRLLAEAGYPGGKGFPSFHYHFNNVKNQENIAVQLQSMWERELGIHADLRAQEWKVYLSTQGKRDYDISRSSWIGDYNDPTTFLDLFISTNPNNRTGWTNAVYDGLIRQAAVEPNVATRAKMLKQAETLLVEQEVPIVPIYFFAGMEYFDRNVIQGVHPNLRGEHPIRAIRKKVNGQKPGSPAPAVATVTGP